MTPCAILPDRHIERLYILDLGLFDVGPGNRLIGIPAYLLETRDVAGRQGWILFDTGFPPDYASAPEATAARDGLASFGVLVDFSAEHTAAGQLARLGLTPGDIGHVILSHGHIDHVGSLPLFAHAEIFVTETERADPRPCYFGSARPIDWPDTRYHTFATEIAVCAGLSLMHTPGHTPGHLSALVSLPDGRRILLAADAINRISEPAEGFSDARDPASAIASHQKLMGLVAQTGAEVIYGHEPSHWASLPKAPTTY